MSSGHEHEAADRPRSSPPHPTIKAAAITTKDRRGTLLMLNDYTPYTQYQPPQAAFNNLKVVVPAARATPTPT